MDETTPNPGSDEAAAAGCKCSVIANNGGLVEPPTGWEVPYWCPLHYPAARPPDDDAGELVGSGR